MPMAAPTACKETACPRPAEERGRCRVHRRTTAGRGYGPEHRAARAAALAELDPDALCPRCARPLGATAAALELDHSDDRRRYLGLSHSSCNRSARGNA